MLLQPENSSFDKTYKKAPIFIGAFLCFQSQFSVFTVYLKYIIKTAEKNRTENRD